MSISPFRAAGVPRILLGVLGLSSCLALAEPATVNLITENSPFTRVSDVDQSGGEATVFTQQVFADAGISTKLQYLPWRRAYKYASTEPNTLIFPLARTPQREARFHWVGQLIPVNYYLFKLKSRNDIAPKTLEEARQYRIGVVNYHVHHEYLLSESFTDLQPVNNNVQNLKKALLGRIDLFPISDGGLVPVCLRQQIDCSRFEPVLKLQAISGGLHMAFSARTDPALVEATRNSYQALVDSGFHRQLFQQRLENIEQFNALWPLAVDPGVK